MLQHRRSSGGRPLIEMRDLVKHFGHVIALNGVSLTVDAGEVHCLLGDNGAGKSTLIKTLSGVLPADRRRISWSTASPSRSARPRDALDAGIATVYQDLAMVPLMSVTRNFFMGREPRGGVGPFRYGLRALRRRRRATRCARSASTCATRTSRRHAVRRRAPVRGDRARGLFRRQSADPRRADLRARREQTSMVLKYINQVARAGASASSSSPTTSATPAPSASASPCSTAAARWARSPNPKSASTSCRT